MLLRMTFRLWKKYDLQHKLRVEQHALKGEQNYESSREDLGAFHSEHSPTAGVRPPARRRSSQRVVMPPTTPRSAEARRKSVAVFLRAQGKTEAK